MNNREYNENDYRSLLLLDEISRDDKITQRDLSKNLGIALGLINSYIKNLVSKGYITISTIPKNRYKYFITPTGFTEKTRLTYTHLRNFTNLYRVARRDFSTLFRQLKETRQGTAEIVASAGPALSLVFCGTGEVAEIAYLSLKEEGLELKAIVDDQRAGGKFFGLTIAPLENIAALAPDLIIITSFQRGEELKNALLSHGIPDGAILDISGGDWIKKIKA